MVERKDMFGDEVIFMVVQKVGKRVIEGLDEGLVSWKKNMDMGIMEWC